MQLFAQPLAAAILTAGCYLSLPTVNVLAESPQSGSATSATEMSDQKLSAVAAASPVHAAFGRIVPRDQLGGATIMHGIIWVAS
jgi:hypothetical protein